MRVELQVIPFDQYIGPKLVYDAEAIRNTDDTIQRVCALLARDTAIEGYAEKLHCLVALSLRQLMNIGITPEISPRVLKELEIDHILDTASPVIGPRGNNRTLNLAMGVSLEFGDPDVPCSPTLQKIIDRLEVPDSVERNRPD